MTEAKNRQIILVSRPHGEPKPENFKLAEAPIPAIGLGQVLLKTKFLSLDPYMRGRMSDAKSYVPPFAIGEPLGGQTVSEVIASNNPEFAAGDMVLAFGGWQDYSVSNGSDLRKLDPSAAPCFDRPWCSRNAGNDCVCRASKYRAPEGRRDACGCRRGWASRLRGWSDREDQRLSGCGHRRRQGEDLLPHR